VGYLLLAYVFVTPFISLLIHGASKSLCTSFFSYRLPCARWPWDGSISGEKILGNYRGSGKRPAGQVTVMFNIRPNLDVATVVLTHSTQPAVIPVGAMSSSNNMDTHL
jgi:hypothetical protein